MNDTAEQTDLDQRIDTLERVYEFLLSYAARGTDGRDEQNIETGIRANLEKGAAALEGLAQTALAETVELDPAFAAWIDVLSDDSRKSLIGIRLVLAQSAISSQLVDNLNASIHLRAILTDLFVLDEAIKSTRRDG